MLCSNQLFSVVLDPHVVKRKERQSNIELLRIVAIFLVLVVHADFWANGIPTQEECVTSVLPSFTRFFIESLSIVCVDVFVLISGWFGIRPNIQRMSAFIFQCFFFLGGLYIVSLICGFGHISGSGILGCFALLHWNWFIKAYIALCILAPILNKYIDNSDEKSLRTVVLWFYVFQCLYGWLFEAAKFIEAGYSVFSFVGLYLLAQYIKRFKIEYIKRIKGYAFTFIYVGIVIFNTIWGYLSVKYGIPFFYCIFNYTSPLVIIASLSLVFAFQKIRIQSKFVNWVAASSFAVFLFHVCPALNEVFFKSNCIEIYEEYSGIECLLYMFLFLGAIFVFSILLDKIRILIWKWLSTAVFQR